MTFAQGLRTIRSDPDVVLVGDQRGQLPHGRAAERARAHRPPRSTHRPPQPGLPARKPRSRSSPACVDASCVVAQSLLRRVCSDCRETSRERRRSSLGRPEEEAGAASSRGGAAVLLPGTGHGAGPPCSSALDGRVRALVEAATTGGDSRRRGGRGMSTLHDEVVGFTRRLHDVVGSPVRSAQLTISRGRPAGAGARERSGVALRRPWFASALPVRGAPSRPRARARRARGRLPPPTTGSA
jgi:hypothetical protein